MIEAETLGNTTRKERLQSVYLNQKIVSDSPTVPIDSTGLTLGIKGINVY
jgi:hypothetical protein